MSDCFRILFVCTGNICRSPMAERLTRAALDRRLGADAARVQVTSAGTWGHEGAPMEQHALGVLDAAGIDGSDFRARELTAAMVADADLVLTAQREHRAAVVTLLPRASLRTFTMREFARLLADVAPESLPADVVERGVAMTELAASRRGIVPAASDGDDLADPYGAPRSAFDVCATGIIRALQGPIGLLAPPGGPSVADDDPAARAVQ